MQTKLVSSEVVLVHREVIICLYDNSQPDHILVVRVNEKRGQLLHLSCDSSNKLGQNIIYNTYRLLGKIVIIQTSCK